MMMYRPLLWFDQKHRIDWTQSLASGIKVNDDDTSFTITLQALALVGRHDGGPHPTCSTPGH